MTTIFKQESVAEPSPASQSNCFDPLDIDRYINYDPTSPSPSLSPTTSRAKSIAPQPITKSNIVSSQPPPQQFFPGPSHRYEQYKQHTGLPVGALANTFALNEQGQFFCGRGQSYDMIPPTDGFFGRNTTEDFLDFGIAPGQTSPDMDLDFASPLDPLSSTFIDPAAIGGQENTPHSQPAPAHPVRVYPGMHQEAALAKSRADAEQQQQRRQQATAHQQQNVNSSQSRTSSHSRTASSAAANDPLVEESISRLLNRMRQSSVASSNDDDAATPNANGNSSSNARLRKEDEDMDEDERLLASEEGKKLSSKERRQLRNKVSARAFRSRRKEYIGQLEGEIATKSAEADELRTENQELKDENTRLTDLTRMLLSSPAFSTFLNDLSGAGVPASLPQQPERPALPPQTATPKDVNPTQATSRRQSHAQNTTHVGMTIIPESLFEHNTPNSTNRGFGDNTMDYSLYDAQVFVVTSLPQGPAVDSLDFSMLHGKSPNSLGAHPACDDPKDEPALIEPMPAPIIQEDVAVVTLRKDLDLDESDPAFALFMDEPAAPVKTCTVTSEERLFGETGPEKASERLELVVNEGKTKAREVTSATLERFDRLCLRIDGPSARVTAVTSHL